MNSEKTWLHQADMIDSDYYDRYWKSFFVTTTSMFGAVIYTP
jgi:hypothetical protein